MDTMKRLAITALALAGLSGCTSMQIADLAAPEGAQAQAVQGEETRVSRPLSGYGTMGGYRYRRFAAVAKAT